MTNDTTTSVVWSAGDPCGYCGGTHSGVCPRIEEIEYHRDGSVKRVRFRDDDGPSFTPYVPYTPVYPTYPTYPYWWSHTGTITG